MAYLAFQRFFYGNGMHGLTDGFVRRDDAVPLNGQLRALDLLAECVAKHAPCAQFLKDGAAAARRCWSVYRRTRRADRGRCYERVRERDGSEAKRSCACWNAAWRRSGLQACWWRRT